MQKYALPLHPTHNLTARFSFIVSSTTACPQFGKTETVKLGKQNLFIMTGKTSFLLIKHKTLQFGCVRFFLAQALHGAETFGSSQPPFCFMMDHRSVTTSSMGFFPPLSPNKLNFSSSLSSTFFMADIGADGVSETCKQVALQ